ncbi:MAG: WYL domain-containing protein [Cellulomonadaceae bacterium]|jgi:proteasome accessory factor B|nr:WYL domain-containing protein [Cellulomonadaceae bacterium]
MTNPVISADERLIALWHALDSTELGRTKAELRRVVPGYSDVETGDAFERMFSRDKQALRKAGAEVETRGAGTTRERYRLAKKQPGPVVDLTPAEVGAVRLAAALWQAGELHENADNAARKLIGNDVKPDSLESFSAPIPFIPAKRDLLNPLLKAIGNRSRVGFAYRNPASGEFRPRVVEPWRLAFRDGGWYLLGKDVELGQARAFRLSRISGQIQVAELRNTFAAVSDIDVSELLGETGHLVTALLAIAPGRAARVRAGGNPVSERGSASDSGAVSGSAAVSESAAAGKPIPKGYELHEYRYDDEREFADELAGFGPLVVVISPPQLKAAVLKRLKAATRLAA